MSEATSPPTGETAKTLSVPARQLPAPRSISLQARASLESRYDLVRQPSPEPGDLEAWRRYIDAAEAPFQLMAETFLTGPGPAVEAREVGGAKVYVASPSEPSTAPCAHLYLHGGGWTMYGGSFCAALGRMQAASLGTVTYAVDYRMPPLHPFPAALDDCLAAYAELLKSHDPSGILVSGNSAGGNLAAALMLRARDEGLPVPRALVLDTPAVDLTRGSDTIHTLDGIDPIIGTDTIAHSAPLYAGGADIAHPYISPINGDLSGFPPTYLKTGTRDLMLSDTVRMHAALRKAGVDADLYVGEAMPHGGFALPVAAIPEDKDARADLRRWVRKQFGA